MEVGRPTLQKKKHEFEIGGFLNVKPCHPVQVYRRFLKNLLPPTTAQLVVTYKAARRHAPKQRSLHTTNIFKLLSPQRRHNSTSTCLPNSIWQIIRKGKDKVRLTTGYQGREVGWVVNATPRPLFLR